MGILPKSTKGNFLSFTYVKGLKKKHLFLKILQACLFLATHIVDFYSTTTVFENEVCFL